MKRGFEVIYVRSRSRLVIKWTLLFVRFGEEEEFALDVAFLIENGK